MESGVFVADLANWTAIIQLGLRTLPEHNQLMPSNSSPQAHVQAWASARGLHLEIDEEANELRILDPLFRPKQTPPQAVQPRLFEE